MSGPKHTPGPWDVEHLDDGLWVTGPDRDAPIICDLLSREYDEVGPNYSAVFTDEDDANACLIAAAPDLLEALEMVRDADDDCKRDGLPTLPSPARKRIDAALAKVRGES